MEMISLHFSGRPDKATSEVSLKRHRPVNVFNEHGKDIVTADSRIFGFFSFFRNMQFFVICPVGLRPGGFAMDWKLLWASNRLILSPYPSI